MTVERCDAALHHPLLPEVREVTGDERDQEWGAGNRPVETRDLRCLDALFLGDHPEGHIRPLIAGALGPLDRCLGEALASRTA